MSSYTFKILQERVSDNDDFEEKTHEKVASNIHRIIESSTPAITIGLEGGWGSGKSTVVNLLTNKLSESKGRTLVYLFDAWAHDGDPLRRIFLEGLIAKIDPEEADTSLQNIKQEISGRKKTVEVKTKKALEKKSFLWKSDGKTGFTIKEIDKSEIGTDITLSLIHI